MFGKKPKQESGNPPRRKGADLMNQMGFGGMEDMDAMVYGGDDDDDDLEAELAALTGDVSESKKVSPKKKGPVDLSVIESMAAKSMQDIDNEDMSDTEDPDLMAELEELSDDESSPPVASTSQPATSRLAPAAGMTSQDRPQVLRVSPSPSPSQSQGLSGVDQLTLVQDRITMYQKAQETARAVGDDLKQRRLDRGLKALTDILRKVKAGKTVSEEEIPPPVAITAGGGSNTPSPAASTPSPTHPGASEPKPSSGHPARPAVQDVSGCSHIETSSSSISDNKTREVLESRRDQYRHAALAAKKAGDLVTATKYVKTAKQFDMVMEALDQGKPVDLSSMPPPPPSLCASGTSPALEVRVQRSAVQGTGEKDSTASEEIELPAEPTEEESKRLFQAPDAPKTVIEALVQRLEKYRSAEDSAKTAGDSGKARRMGRIVKQYEDAIKAHKAGRAVDFDELPTPPGFGPIPKDLGPSPSKRETPPSVAAPAAGAKTLPAPPRPAPKPPIDAGKQVPTVIPATSSASGASAAQPLSRSGPARKSTNSRQEQQLSFLRERQEEFRTAALQAKRNNDIELAKHHMRMMKGLEPMIEALEAGLPVDLSQVPPSPLADEDNEDKYVVVTAADCTPTGDRQEVFAQLEQDLLSQIRTCATNAQHFTKLGDVPAASKFQKLEQGCRKDLDSLKSALRHGDPVPKFHYETRSFSVVQCNTDLGDSDMEVSIIRGISYNLPSGFSEKDMDTAVKYEFAFPSAEEAQTGHTQTIKNTINPEYGEVFKLQINRKSRGFARVIERKGMKFDVFIKRGFFKGDKVLGTTTVKLNILETKCTLHDSFDLMEGRKTVGGKLEVKIRVRDPFKSRQVDEVKEKWLVIDQFIKTTGSKSQITPATSGEQKSKLCSIA
ncbi:coiled-coil and C2 domain-containing protein 1-like isoform X2 [Pomacea canaliculata]|uniref:coiled-coil and C2 domain-containing protein 1-like isoform X2 n=1 Tax=Pomacea canaliculata TaxID=400727 RepID=UPI000D736EB7|nr:coiled-coil and C2 domain-containing protein 1-like isoform X2 [Pomacea canaliculata]